MLYVNGDAPLVGYEDVVRSPYFVDKSDLISAIIPLFSTTGKFLCITRPRRFGKTINAQMIAAFLTRGTDALSLFKTLKVAGDQATMAHCGTHDVIYVDLSALPDNCESFQDYLDAIRRGIVNELRAFAPDAGIDEGNELVAALQRVYEATKTRFCFVMDEWDAMFFNPQFSREDQRSFLMFLKQLLKSKPYVEFAYMTGILPIAKHSVGSELNMFSEYSAVEDPRYARYFGFTECEVHDLCALHRNRVSNARVDYEGLRHWYDGYLTESGERMFNPQSVSLALADDSLRSYWTESGPYDEIYFYVRNNVAAVRDDLVRMVAGESVRAEIDNYAASSMSLTTKDEILSAMVVYGFLTCHRGLVSIPNHELMLKFRKLLAREGMGYVARLARRSEEILAATLRKDAETIVRVIEAAHDQEIPLLRYANEADLAALVNLVYLSARDRYRVRREEPAGKGVADLLFVPMGGECQGRPFVVELKCGGSALDAIAQIRAKDYGRYFQDALSGEGTHETPLAVGISWDPKTKRHDCRIEEL